MIGVIKMVNNYLKHKYKVFKSSLVGSFLGALLTYFILSLLVKSSSLFDSVHLVYTFLVIGLTFLLIFGSSVFFVSFSYILFGDDIRRDFYGNVELDFMNLFNLYVSKVFPKEFKKSVKFLDGVV
jgi:hypothetical protein